MIDLDDDEARCLEPVQQQRRNIHLKDLQLLFQRIKQSSYYLQTRHNYTLFPHELPTRKEVEWAYKMKITRGFALPPPHGFALVPIMDLFNHDSRYGIPAGVYGLNEFKSMIHHPSMLPPNAKSTSKLHTLLATKNLDVDEEVFISYAPLSIQGSFAFFGFLPAEPVFLSVTAIQESCSEIKDEDALVCLDDFELKVPRQQGTMTSTAYKGATFRCERSQPHQSFQDLLVKCAGATSYAEPRPKRLLRDALTSMIKETEAAEPRCQGNRQANFTDNMLLVSKVRQAMLAGLRLALQSAS